MSKTKALVVLCLFVLVGCTDAQCARRAARHKDQRIRLWSGGAAVVEWTSEGHASADEGSSLIHFKDKETGLYVRLRGTISIEQLAEGE